MTNLDVARVIHDFANSIYVDSYGDTREAERNEHLREKLFGLSEEFQDFKP